MRDPYVRALHYRLEHGDTVDYEKAKPLDHETDEFKVRLDEGEAVFEMKKHHTTPESARSVVEPFIKAWEVSAGLAFGPGEFNLIFKHPEVIDRNPEPGTHQFEFMAGAISRAHYVMHASRGNYPGPPQDFQASPDVQTMFLRWRL